MPDKAQGAARAEISDREFSRFQALLYRIAGIHMSDAKKVLLVGRLSKRLKHLNLSTFGAYYDYVTAAGHSEELQIMVDLLTTHETYFFREPKHFDFLAQEVLPALSVSSRFEAWSAACSSGEEAYTLAMLLADKRPAGSWQVTASDISTDVLNKARKGHYPIERNEGIPQDYLRRFCLRGVRAQAGTFLINQALRERVRFMHINLNQDLPDIGPFDVIFLRNVMIYFDAETKSAVVNRLAQRLRPGGYLIIGHSESLNGITCPLKAVRPTIYRRP